jgi:hypothetical protein
MSAPTRTPSKITLENDPPRPASGDGEVIFNVGDKALTLTWRGNELVDVADASSSFAKDKGGARIQVETLDAIQCYKCWVDTVTGAWICLPTQC